MIEVLAVPLLIIAASLFPKMKQNDKKIIQTVFTNVGFEFRKGGEKGEVEMPRLKNKVPILVDEEEIGTTYIYSLPPGLRTDYVHHETIANALGKPAEIEFKRGVGLQVHVYEEDIKDFIPFRDKVTKELLVPAPKKEKDGPNQGKNMWTVVLGRGLRGWLVHNFDHVPHMTIAGTTRFGKSVLLRLIMTYLILFHPDDVEFYIIDLKGKLEFSRYRKLRQVKAVAGTPKEALEVLTYLSQEEEIRDPKTGELVVPRGIFDKELDYFETHDISNITETDMKKRRFILIDEGAQLTPNKFTSDAEERMACQFKLSRIASVFGAIGVRLIYGTQYPTAKNLNPDVKMNSDAKISFRLPAGYASEVAIDEYGAEKLPSDIKGRALMKTHEMKEMQVPFITHEDAWEELERYQDPVKVEGVQEDVIDQEFSRSSATGSYPVFSGPHEVRNKGTDTKDSYVRL